MSKLETLSVYGTIIGFTSTIFMVYVFFNEAILGRGVLFIEPLVWLATLELVMSLVGLGAVGFVMIALIIGKADSSAKPDDTDDVMPAPAEAPKRLWN